MNKTNNKKSTNKKTVVEEPKYTVDLTDVETAEDMLFAFAEEKLYTFLTSNEIDAIIEEIIAEAFDGLEIKIVKEKKPNIFKRFWNWITRKK